MSSKIGQHEVQAFMARDLYGHVHDAIRRSIFMTGAADMMIPHAEAAELYEQCKEGLANTPAYRNAEWTATACTDAAIRAVQEHSTAL